MTNRHSPTLVAVKILNFSHDALRVQAHDRLFLMLSVLKNIQILHNKAIKNASFFYFDIINKVFTRNDKFYSPLKIRPRFHAKREL